MPRLSGNLNLSKRVVAVAAIFFVTMWIVAGLYIEYVQRLQAERMERTEALADVLIGQTRSAFREVPLLTASEAADLRTYRNAAHVERARELGIPSIESRDAATVLAQEAGLVELTDTPYFRVRDLDFSIPYVTPSTANLLTLLGIRFQQALHDASLPPYRYVITSVTRTQEDQRRLQGVNVNAAAKSSHEFGTTVDLHYQDFAFDADIDPVPDSVDIYHEVLKERLAEAYRELAHTRQQKLKAILGRVLLELQEEGKVLVIYERRQPVYHITLGERIAAPRNEPTLRPAAPASFPPAASTRP